MDDDLITPPEIREIGEKFELVEFYVHLGDGRPDLELFQLIYGYLEDRGPRAIMGLTISYHRDTARGDPNVMVGNLFLGEGIDTEADGRISE